MPARETLQSGQSLGGCIIVSLIARGGMGAVYRARQRLIDRDVAIKVIRPEIMKEPPLIARFLREAKLAAGLDHPAIIRVYDAGEDADTYFIVMEYVDGRDLKSLVQSEGPMASDAVLRVAKQVAEGLAYAHERGIVHRDIKPANILLSSSGQAKIADLGLAHFVEQDHQVTQTGQIVGTPVFMSPEQCRGEPADPRSDLYSLGATLYVVLSGKLPFYAESTASLVHKIIHERPPSLLARVPELSPKVNTLVQRLMAKHPMARFQTASDVVDAINDILVNRFVVSGKPPKKEPEPVAERFAWGRLAGLVLVGTLLGVGVYFLAPSTETSASSGQGEASGHDAHGKGPGSLQLLPGPSGAPKGSGHGAVVSPVAGSDDQQAAALRGKASDPALERRVRGFCSSLLSNDSERILEYLEPSVRSQQSLHFSLARILDAIGKQNMQPGVFFVDAVKANEANVLVLFRHEKDGRSVGVPLAWVRVDDQWYVKPRAPEVRNGAVEPARGSREE